MSRTIKEEARRLIAELPADATLERAIEVIAHHAEAKADGPGAEPGRIGAVNEPGLVYVTEALEPSLVPGSRPYYGRDAADRVIRALAVDISWAGILEALSVRKAIDAGLADMALGRRHRHDEIRMMFGLQP